MAHIFTEINLGKCTYKVYNNLACKPVLSNFDIYYR